jgi:DNA-binding NtrC family response regulator
MVDSTAQQIAWASPMPSGPIREALEALVGPVAWIDRAADPAASGVTVVDGRLPAARALLARSAGQSPVLWLGPDLPDKAFDALPLDATPQGLARALRAALRHAALWQDRDDLARALEQGRLAGLVGGSARFRELVRLVRRASASPHPALVTGPRGSGKDAVARALHNLARRPGAFATLRCAAVPPHTHSSQLFGVHQGRPPLWQASQRGTLYLDEVEALAADAQATLIARLDEPHHEVRVVASSRVDLEAVEGFRSDLHFRLAVLHVHVPSLQARAADIEILAEHLLERLGPDDGGRPWSLSTDAAMALRGWRWPGNVRELRDVLEAAAERARRGPLAPEHLGLVPTTPRPELMDDASNNVTNLRELEREVVARTLEEVGGNVNLAVERLGVPRSTLYRKIKRWGLR